MAMAAPIADLPAGPNVKHLLPVKPRNALLTNWDTIATIKHYPGPPTFIDLTRWNPTSPAEPSISAGLWLDGLCAVP